MTRGVRVRVSSVRRAVRAFTSVLCTLLIAAPEVWAQAGQPPPPRTQQPSSKDSPPYSLDRIKEELEKEPLLTLDLNGLPVFRLEVIERRPRTFELSGQFDVPWRPRPGMPAWHDEFLRMVTPEEARPWSPLFTSGEIAQLAGTSLASLGVMELAAAAARRWSAARRRAAEAAAREEVDEALREFERQRRRP